MRNAHSECKFQDPTTIIFCGFFFFLLHRKSKIDSNLSIRTRYGNSLSERNASLRLVEKLYTAKNEKKNIVLKPIALYRFELYTLNNPNYHNVQFVTTIAQPFHNMITPIIRLMYNI